MPNALAFLMLAIWPIVTVVLFQRLPLSRALITSMVAGYLILPEPPAVFDLPLFPPFDKHNIPALSSLACILMMYGRPKDILPRSRVARGLVLTFILSPILTVATNTEPVFYGRIGLPGLGWKDAIALTLRQVFFILPFLIAREHLKTRENQRELMLALVIGALAYALPMLIEVRLSPQLNNWIYGYYQHIFGQSIRGGGYRPIVFLYHGLWTSFFVMTAVICAFSLWRLEKEETGKKYFFVAVFLFALLVLAKSLGALIFAVIGIPIVIFLGRIWQIKVAIIIGALAVAYPVMKGADLVPEEQLLAQAAAIEQDRAASLEFRFTNENTLLERAYEKPWFGWGSWGRNHILDPVSGVLLTVTDGRWIILIGVYGWIGFLAEFGLVLLPILYLWREAIASREDIVSPYIAPLSILLAINLADMIPNATLTPLTWLIAGALLSHAEMLRARRLEQGDEPLLRWQSIM